MATTWSLRIRNIHSTIEQAQNALDNLRKELTDNRAARPKRLRNLYDDVREEMASLELQMGSLRKHKPGQEARTEAKRGRKSPVHPVSKEDFEERWKAALDEFESQNDLALDDTDWSNHLSELVIHMEAALGLEVQDASQAEPHSVAALHEHYHDILGMNEE